MMYSRYLRCIWKGRVNTPPTSKGKGGKGSRGERRPNGVTVGSATITGLHMRTRGNMRAASGERGPCPPRGTALVRLERRARRADHAAAAEGTRLRGAARRGRRRGSRRRLRLQTHGCVCVCVFRYALATP